MKRILIFVSIIYGSYTNLAAQDAVFSQYFGNPVYLNPALVGNKQCPRITLNYRNQWIGIDNGYSSFSASYDQNVPVLSGSIGVILNGDRYAGGLMNKYSGYLIYAFQTQVTDQLSLSVAMQAGYLSYNISVPDLVFGDQLILNSTIIKPTNEELPVNESVSNLDFGAGLTLGLGENYFIGTAIHHITQPQLSFYQYDSYNMDVRITAHAGAIFDIRKVESFYSKGAMSIVPNVLYMQQGVSKQLNSGAYMNCYPFVVGAWYRYCFNNSDAVIALVGIEQPNYKIGYSFDYPLSQISVAYGGSHEVSFVWLFNKEKKKNKKYNKS